MKKYRDFIAGMLTMLLIVTLASTAMATTGKVQREIEYRNIRVALDGKVLDLKDSTGKSVEPFMMDGSNYLPVRALAEALGLYVSWDGENNTVVLTTEDSTSGTLFGIEAAQEKISSIYGEKDGVTRVTAKAGAASASDKLYVSINYGEPYGRADFQTLLTDTVEEIISIAKFNNVNIFFIEVELSIDNSTNIYWHSYNRTTSIENSKVGDLFDVENDTSFEDVSYTDVSSKLSNSKPVHSVGEPTNRTVYVTKTGKRYHYSSSCNGGTYIASTLSQAKAKGLTPCNKCAK